MSVRSCVKLCTVHSFAYWLITRQKLKSSEVGINVLKTNKPHAIKLKQNHLHLTKKHQSITRVVREKHFHQSWVHKPRVTVKLLEQSEQKHAQDDPKFTSESTRLGPPVRSS